MFKHMNPHFKERAFIRVTVIIAMLVCGIAGIFGGRLLNDGLMVLFSMITVAWAWCLILWNWWSGIHT